MRRKESGVCGGVVEFGKGDNKLSKNYNITESAVAVLSAVRSGYLAGEER